MHAILLFEATAGMGLPRPCRSRRQHYEPKTSVSIHQPLSVAVLDISYVRIGVASDSEAVGELLSGWLAVG